MRCSHNPDTVLATFATVKIGVYFAAMDTEGPLRFHSEPLLSGLGWAAVAALVVVGSAGGMIGVGTAYVFVAKDPLSLVIGAAVGGAGATGLLVRAMRG